MRVNPGNHTALRCYLSAGFRRVDPATEADWNTGQPTAYQWLTHHTPLTA